MFPRVIGRSRVGHANFAGQAAAVTMHCSSGKQYEQLHAQTCDLRQKKREHEYGVVRTGAVQLTQPYCGPEQRGSLGDGQ